MTKEVFVSIKGKQIGADGTEEELIESICFGNYYEKNGKIYIMYDEQPEGISTKISNTIKISNEQVEHTKKGAIGSQMVFRENETINSCYQTPYGDMLMSITTSKMYLSKSTDLIEIVLCYSIEMNGSHLSDSKVTITVSSKSDHLNLV